MDDKPVQSRYIAYTLHLTDQLQVLSEIGSGTHGRVRLGQDMTAEIPAADDDGDLHPPTSPDNSFYVGNDINLCSLD